MLTIIGRLTIKQGCEAKARAVLKQLAKQVQDAEPDTLLYLVHVPDMKQLSLPTPSPLEVTFLEGYKDKKALDAHLNGKAFTQFKAKHMHLFLTTIVTGQDGKPVESPFAMFESLHRLGGFVRAAASGG